MGRFRLTWGGRRIRQAANGAYQLIRPTHVVYLAWASRALAYLKAGKAAQALPDAERSLQLRPNHADTLDTRGHIFEALGRREEAIADFRRALSMDPTQPGSWHALNGSARNPSWGWHSKRRLIGTTVVHGAVRRLRSQRLFPNWGNRRYAVWRGQGSLELCGLPGYRPDRRRRWNLSQRCGRQHPGSGSPVFGRGARSATRRPRWVHN